MELVLKIGDSIHELIQLEIDYLSNHEDKKMLLLDLKVSVVNESSLCKIMYDIQKQDLVRIQLLGGTRKD